MSSRPDPVPDSPTDYDPVYLRARRELVVIVLLFAIFCIWAVGVCYVSGYVAPGGEPEEISLTLGMPSWAFWGLLVPWLAVDAVAVWFCFFYMRDDDLGEAHEGEDLAEQVEHMHEVEARKELKEWHEHQEEAGGERRPGEGRDE